MKRLGAFPIKQWGHRALRSAFRLLPDRLAQASNRAITSFDPHPSPRLTLKIAETQQELEACFKLVHDCQVAQHLIAPHPSGLALSLFNAAPSSLVICAKFDDTVIGTVTLFSESVFGLPMQNRFDLSLIRKLGGKLAQAVDLAIDPRWRQSGGAVLWPLLKALIETCQRRQIRHLAVVVGTQSDARLASLLVSIMKFQRLAGASQAVRHAQFLAAPDKLKQPSEQGFSLDLTEAKSAWKRSYQGKPLQKNFYYYFSKYKLPHLDLPDNLHQVSREPPFTPAMLDYFFNQKTQLFYQADGREKTYLYRLYYQPWYAKVLPLNFEHLPADVAKRQFPRFAASCLGLMRFEVGGAQESISLTLVDCSLHGFLAFSASAVPLKVWGDAIIHQGLEDIARFKAMAVTPQAGAGFYGFKLAAPDPAWRQFITSLATQASVKKVENPQILSKL